MNRRFQSFLVLVVILIAGVCHGSERVEIVLDASTAMWESFQTGVPRIVAARQAINALIVSPDIVNREMEIGLRSIGGLSDSVHASGCGDTGTLISPALIDPNEWSGVLSRLDPKGGRALVRAVEETVESLAEYDGTSRIVVLTSGDDQCYEDITATLERLGEEKEIRIRVIGLDLERKFSNSMLLSTPTRNVADPALLFETLQWAVLHPEAASTRPELLELEITHGGEPLTNASVHLDDPSADEDVVAAIENGNARLRIKTGLHRATINGPDLEAIEITGIVHDGLSGPLEIGLSKVPAVTLETIPERPLAGSEVSIHYWGAPVGDNWLAVAVSSAPAGDFIERSPAPGPEGDITLTLPDSPNTLEIQFTRNIGSGVQQLLGRTVLTTDRRKISIEAPESVEIQTPLQVSWNGTTLDGDHITVAASENDSVDIAACIVAVETGTATTTAPVVPGEYVFRFVSRRGRILDQAKIQVFEILATLDGPAQVAAGGNIAIAWTGPDGQQDHLSLAEAGAADDQYLSWAPTVDGNPTRLTIPHDTGQYEIRYVRGEDGEVLARQPLEVVAIEITIDVPSVVTAGTRFNVEWTGTAADGDFIAVARIRSNTKNYLDWAYASSGSPVNLAAPFDPGTYVVRYISGANREIIARQRISVR